MNPDIKMIMTVEEVVDTNLARYKGMPDQDTGMYYIPFLPIEEPNYNVFERIALYVIVAILFIPNKIRNLLFDLYQSYRI